MSKHLRQLFLNLLWLGGLAGLGVVVILLLSNSRATRTVQAPEPTPIPLSTATPTATAPAARFDSPIATPTPEATEPLSTLEPSPTAIQSPTPLPNATPVPAGEALLYTVRREVSGQVEALVYSLAINASGEPDTTPFAIPLLVDFYPVLESISPDGNYILFSRSTESGGRPYILNLKSGGILPLYNDVAWGGGRSFDWYPDSSQILFWDLNNDQLRAIDIRTGDYRVLSTAQGSIQGATISPDDQEVIYIDGPNLTSRILYRVHSQGGEPEALIDLIPPAQIYHWSPDGQYLLYYGSPQLSKEDMAEENFPPCVLTLLEVSSLTTRFLNCPSDTLPIFEPVWSPDSRHIAYTAVGDNETFPCQQQDGQEIDWHTCYFQGTFIYIEDIQSGEVSQLSPGIIPRWSPDGSQLAFLSNQSGSPEIWLVNADGGNLRQATNDGLPKEHKLFWTILRSEQ